MSKNELDADMQLIQQLASLLDQDPRAAHMSSSCAMRAAKTVSTSAQHRAASRMALIMLANNIRMQQRGE